MKRTIIALFTVLTIFALTAVSVFAARQLPQLAVANNHVAPVVDQPSPAANMVSAVEANSVEEIVQLHAPITVENRFIDRVETGEPSETIVPVVAVEAETAQETTNLTALDGNPLSACLPDASGVANSVVVAPGERFMQSWDVKNAGICRWNTNYQLAFVRGTKMGNITQVSLVQSVGSGSSANFWAQLIAPTTLGNYEMAWQMQDEFGNLFGGEMVTQVTVTNNPLETVEQPTATNQLPPTDEVVAVVTGGTNYTANRYRLDFHRPSAKEMADSYLGSVLTIKNNVLTFNGKSCTLDQSSSKRVDTGSYLVHTYGRSPGSLAFAPGAMTVMSCGEFGEVMFNHNYIKTPQVVLRLDGMFVYFLQD
jgi:hypothetical protein